MKKLYFGHPKGSYDTRFEKIAITRIQRSSALFSDWPTLVNPNDPIHERGAEEYRRSTGSESSTPYFLELVRSCDKGVFLAMPNGMWGCDTALEAQELLKKDSPVWVMAFDGTLHQVDSISPTRILTREETTDWNNALRAMNKATGH